MLASVPDDTSIPTTSPGPAAPTRRLAWLDALRGIAALVVAAHHFRLIHFIPGGERVARHFDLGIFGVFLFFLISGWIIPASLERRGDVRRFWVGRLFRIYPLVILVVALAWLLPARYSPVKHEIPYDTGWSLLANATLLHDFLGVRSAIGILWTLGFEMIFYYLTTALFMSGRERSTATPLFFAGFSLFTGAATTSAWITTTWDSWFTRHVLIAVTAASTVLGLGLLMSRAHPRRMLGAYVLAFMSLGLLFNPRAPLFEVGAILATMFTGTVCFRWHAREMPARTALPVITCTVVACAVSGAFFNAPPRSDQTWVPGKDAYVLPFLAAWAVFGLGALWSKRTWPSPLSWLGRISYSVYIIHVPLMWAIFWLNDTYLALPGGLLGNWVIFTLELACLLVLSQLSFRYVERPGQRLGAQVGRRLDPMHDGRTSSRLEATS